VLASRGCEASVDIPAQRRPQISPKVAQLIVPSAVTLIRPSRLSQHLVNSCYDYWSIINRGQFYPAFCAPVAVLGRDLDGTEAVDCDTEDRVDGTQTDGVVERQPQITDDRTERPVLAHQEVDGVERHGYGSDEQVADGQRRDEVVGRLSDVALHNERQNHDEVAADRQNAGGRGQQTKDDDLPNLQSSSFTYGLKVRGWTPRLHS